MEKRERKAILIPVISVIIMISVLTLLFFWRENSSTFRALSEVNYGVTCNSGIERIATRIDNDLLTIQIEGWAIDKTSRKPYRDIYLRVGKRATRLNKKERPDVASAFEIDVAGSNDFGFFGEACLDNPELAQKEGVELLFVSQESNSYCTNRIKRDIFDNWTSDVSYSASVSEDCWEMDVEYIANNNHDSVSFAVWSEENGQDDLAWYVAKKVEPNIWKQRVSMLDHSSTGLYNIHFYAKDGELSQVLRALNPVISDQPVNSCHATVTMDCKSMKVGFRASERYDTVMFAVWSDDNGQDDIKWYTASPSKENEKEWSYTVNLKNHMSDGLYNIHVYASIGDESKLVSNTTVVVDNLPA